MSNATRNAAILQDLNEGLTSTEVGDKYGLSPGRIRAIKRECSNYAANPNKAGQFGEIGVTGLNYSRGIIHEEFLSDINTPSKRYRAFNEMRNNSTIVAAAILAWELSVRRIDWRIEGEDERADFLNEAWRDMSHTWNDHIATAVTTPIFGWSWFEKVYKRRRGPYAPVPSNYDDGKIGWRKMAFRSQDSWSDWKFDDNGGVIALVQQTWPDWMLHIIPIEKSILYRTSTEKNNPEGRSYLRPAWVSYYYAKNLMTIEAIGAERDVAGLPVIGLPQNANTEVGSKDVLRAERMAKSIRIDELGGVVKPFGWEVALLSAAGSKQHNIGEIITRYETRMAMALLAQFLMLGTGDVGSYALSKDQSDFFVMAVSAFADIISETFSKYAIIDLLKLNGLSLVDPPVLTHGPLGTPDLEAISGYFARLTQVGLIRPDTDLEQFLREQAVAPVLTPEEIARREEESERMKELREMIPTKKPENETEDTDGGDESPEDEQPEEMSVSGIGKNYAAKQLTVGDKIKSIPNKDVKQRVQSGAKNLQEIDDKLFAAAKRRLLDVPNAEWEQAMAQEAGGGSERD